MSTNTRISASLAALAVSALVLVGCSSAPKDDAAETKTEKAPQTEEVAKADQSKDEACRLASEALQTAFTEYGAGLGDGSAVDADALLEATKKMSKTLTDASVKITNDEVSKAFSGLAGNVDAMVSTNEEQIKAKADTGAVPEDLNTTLAEKTNKLNEDATALQVLCS